MPGILSCQTSLAEQNLTSVAIREHKNQDTLSGGKFLFSDSRELIVSVLFLPLYDRVSVLLLIRLMSVFTRIHTAFPAPGHLM